MPKERKLARQTFAGSKPTSGLPASASLPDTSVEEREGVEGVEGRLQGENEVWGCVEKGRQARSCSRRGSGDLLASWHLSART